MEDAGADGGGVGNHVSDVFAVFFRRATKPPKKQGPLGRVFEFMFSVLRKESSADLTVPENFFLYELFTMIPNRDFKVAISTTDWCGIYQEGVVSGIVDVLVRPLDPIRRQPVIIGEVKGASGSLWLQCRLLQFFAKFGQLVCQCVLPWQHVTRW